MRKLMNTVVSIAMGMLIGCIAYSNITMTQEITRLEQEIVEVNAVNEITAKVEYHPDGDVVVDYSDGSSILYNEDISVYIMWIPETEDLEHNYYNYDALMCAIENYHRTTRKVVTDMVCVNDANIGALNPQGYSIVAEQLAKIDEDILDLIARTGLEIYYSSNTIESYEEMKQLADNRICLGYYVPSTNYIVMREDPRSIEGALLHEIGHALDNNLGLRNNETIIDSYMNHEVNFTNANNSAYYYSSIAEYIAESIAEYYNGTLDKDTVMYQELDYILGK